MDIVYKEFEHLKIKLEDIKSATNNFHIGNKIGVGGFGKVYKGEICHSKGKSMAAFKRLNQNNRTGQGKVEFNSEISMLSRYTHENLVSLLGYYCDDLEGGEKILVYEYAAHGSLDRHLGNTATLTWIQRIKICLGVARVLGYLHDPQGTHHRVIHRDIKSSNILLDENWNAILSDFGLSITLTADQPYTSVFSPRVGTPGYTDPLYEKFDFLTKESDVYSFGVVLFEVLCGKLCYQYSNHELTGLFVQEWKESYEQDKLGGIIIPDLFQQMDQISLKTFSNIAYKCLERSREDRPKMAEVVKQLEIALESHKAFPSSDADTDWEPKLPNDYEQIIKLSKENVQWTTKMELYFLFRKGFLINSGKEYWFSLTENGKKCYMLCAREALVESEWTWRSLSESRFGEVAYNPLKEIHITYKNKFKMWSTQPETIYASYLVYKLPEDHSRSEVRVTVMDNRSPTTTWTICLLSHETRNPSDRTTITYFPQLRTDGWMEVKVWNFRSHYSWRHVDLTLDIPNLPDGLIVQGIQFKPDGSSSSKSDKD